MVILIVLSLIIVLFMVSCDEGEDDGDEEVKVGEESNWVFTDDNINLGIQGVSAESIILDDGSVRLYVTEMGMRVYRANDGLHFTEEAALLPQGSDPTLIKLDDTTYRMYYVDMELNTKVIWTATSADGLNWLKESSTGIRNTTGGQAWGVPDSVKLPDGSIRLYWVDMPSGDSTSKYEVIRSAISSDGLVFTEESGYRTQDGYVDPYILVAEEGNWIGLFATTPAPERLPQKIYVGTSATGLTWSIESVPIIEVVGGNALDATGVPLGDGSYRIYFTATSSIDAFSGHYMKSGNLRQK